MTDNDRDSTASAERLLEAIDEALRSMTPQERDRQLQIHLAQARGPVRNLRLLCEMTAMLLKAKRLMQAREEQHANERDF